MFATRFGKYTESELKTAYDKLCQGGKDNGKLTVLFKDAGTVTDELKAFKHSFKDNYPGVPSIHFDSESLKKHFLEVWDRYQERELDNNYPIIFKGNHAFLMGERLI